MECTGLHINPEPAYTTPPCITHLVGNAREHKVEMGEHDLLLELGVLLVRDLRDRRKVQRSNH
jgi:hypothetical protein